MVDCTMSKNQCVCSSSATQPGRLDGVHQLKTDEGVLLLESTGCGIPPHIIPQLEHACSSRRILMHKLRLRLLQLHLVSSVKRKRNWAWSRLWSPLWDPKFEFHNILDCALTYTSKQTRLIYSTTTYSLYTKGFVLSCQIGARFRASVHTAYKVEHIRYKFILCILRLSILMIVS